MSSTPLLHLVGLSGPTTARTQRAFEALGCSTPPLHLLTTTLVEFAELCGDRSSVALGQTFAILVAAHHSITKIVPPQAPLAVHVSADVSLHEWLLLVELQRARHPFAPNVDAAIETIVAKLADSHDAGRFIPPQLDDYGFAVLVAALVADSSALVVEAARIVGRCARLLFETIRVTTPRSDLSHPYVLGEIATLVGLGARYSLALALACSPQADRRPLVSVMGHALVSDHIIAECSSWTNRVAYVAQIRGGECFQRCIASLTEQLVSKLKGVRLFGFAAAPNLTGELQRTVSLVVEALRSDRDLREAWEVQRWGDWCRPARVGRVFPVAMCLLALLRAGQDVSAQVTHTIRAARRPDGWRYYDDWTGIPPDTDDLGLLLRLTARVQPSDPDLAPLFTKSLARLDAAIEADGAIPVWIDRDLDEPMPEGSPEWLGPRCVAVAAQLLTGVLEAQIVWPDERIDRAIGWLVQTWNAHREAAIFHYAWPFGRLMLARLAYAVERSTRDLPSRHELRAVVDAIEDSVRQTMLPDGGWGSPLATAAHLSILTISSRPFDPWPSIAYLTSRQRHDGMWSAEPLYRCPGKDGTESAHASVAVTSAVCLDALVDAAAKIRAAS